MIECVAPCSRGTPRIRQAVAADPLDARAHRHEAFGQIGDFRLARGVDQEGLALRQAGRHQQIFGGADRDRREGDLRAPQSFGGARIDIAFAQLDLGAEPLQPLYMEVDGAGADRATARQRYTRAPAACDERPEDEDRSPHLPNEFIGRGARCDVPRRQFDDVSRICALPASDDRDPVLNQQVRHRGDIGENGDIRQGQGFRCQQRRSHQRQCRVFGAADRDYAFERHAALDADLVHRLGCTRAAHTGGRQQPIYWRSRRRPAAFT